MIEQGIDELKHIAKYYKVKVYYSYNLDWAQGIAHKNNFTISLHKNQLPTYERIYSTFFHELGHIHCKRNNIWINYHTANKNDVSAVRRTALKAEIWVDKWAIDEMKKWNPELDYINSYIHLPKYQAKKWIHENYLNKHFKLN